MSIHARQAPVREQPCRSFWMPVARSVDSDHDCPQAVELPGDDVPISAQRRGRICRGRVRMEGDALPFSVFLSYRRNTASGAAGRLYDALTARFGEDEIFMDVDGIAPGADFEDVLEDTLNTCRALIVVVDPQWAAVKNGDGDLRLNDPADFVRLELERALARGIPVFPVLVDGARMPLRTDLPGPLARFASKQALEMSTTRFKYDMEVLLSALEPLVLARGGATPEPHTPEVPGKRPRRVLIWAVPAAVGSLVIAGVFILMLSLGGPPAPAASWADLPDLPIDLEGAGVAAFDGEIWVVGGVSGDEGRALLDTVFSFDPETSKWAEESSLPAPVAFPALVATSDGLLLIGGQGATGAVATVLRLDGESDQWVEAAPLPEPRLAGAGAWDGSRVVFAGGVGTDHAASDTVYALGEAGWESIGVLQIAREKVSAVSDGFGTVWVIGGRDRASGVAAYGAVDVIQVNQITADSPVDPIHSAGGAWFPGAGACVAGGDGAEGVTGAVDCLTDDSFPALPLPRAGLGAATLDGTIYAIGGYGEGDHGSAATQGLHLDEP